MTEFNSEKNGHLHNQSWVKRQIKNFQFELKKLKQYYCDRCHESWPTTKNCCTTCSKDKERLFSRLNNMIPLLDELPPQIQKDFEDLTQIEEMLISPIVPIMSIFRLSGGQLVNNGFCASFHQDIQPITKELPRLAADVSIIVIQKKTKQNQNKDFLCDRYRIERVLKFLIEFNEAWSDLGIEFSQSNLDKLPEYGIPNGLNIIYENENEPEKAVDKGPEINLGQDSEEDDEHNTHGYIEIDVDEAQQVDKIRAKINIPAPNATNPVNEFDQSNLLTLAFPKLFPLGKADPTNKQRLIKVDETEAYRHLMKYLCKDSKGEFYYPFAQHPRFLFYVCDRLRRHITLDQCKVYLKQNPNDATLTIDDLKAILTSGNSKYL